MAEFAHEEELAKHGKGPLAKRAQEPGGRKPVREVEIPMPGGMRGNKRVG